MQAALADDLGSTPGAVAAQLNRSRAKLRVEYLLELHGEPPAPIAVRCFVLSAGDRRRQSNWTPDIISSTVISVLASVGRCSTGVRSQGSRIHTVEHDSDVVVARQRGRDLADRAGSLPPRRPSSRPRSRRSSATSCASGRGRRTMRVTHDEPGVLTVVAGKPARVSTTSSRPPRGRHDLRGARARSSRLEEVMDEFDITSEPAGARPSR